MVVTPVAVSVVQETPTETQPEVRAYVDRTVRSLSELDHKGQYTEVGDALDYVRLDSGLLDQTAVLPGVVQTLSGSLAEKGDVYDRRAALALLVLIAESKTPAADEAARVLEETYKRQENLFHADAVTVQLIAASLIRLKRTDVVRDVTGTVLGRLKARGGAEGFALYQSPERGAYYENIFRMAKAFLRAAAFLPAPEFAKIREDLEGWKGTMDDPGIVAAAFFMFNRQEGTTVPDEVRLNALRSASLTHPVLVGVKAVANRKVLNPARGIAGAVENIPELVVPTDAGAVTASGVLADLKDKAAIRVVKDNADESAAFGIQNHLDLVEALDGRVVIGEGGVDEVWTLQNGQKVGRGGLGYLRYAFPAVEAEIGVDPVELTDGLVKEKIHGSTSVLLVAGKGSMQEAPEIYFNGWFSNGKARVDASRTTRENIEAIAKGAGKTVDKLRIGILFRALKGDDRHKNLVREIIKAGVPAAYYNGMEWVRVNASEDIEFEKYIAYVAEKIKADGTFGLQGPGAELNGIKFFDNGTVGAVKAVGKGQLDALAGSSKFAEAEVQAAMAKGYGINYSGKFHPSGKVDVTRGSWEDLSDADRSQFERSGYNKEKFEKATFTYYTDGTHDAKNELVKGSDFAVHISSIKPDAWEADVPGVRFDEEDGTITVRHEVIGGSGRVEIFDVIYDTKFSKALEDTRVLKRAAPDTRLIDTRFTLYQKAVTFIGLANGLRPELLVQVLGEIEKQTEPRFQALKLFAQAKQIILQGGDKAQAITLLERAVAKDPDDLSGLIVPFLRQLKGESQAGSQELIAVFNRPAARESLKPRSELRFVPDARFANAQVVSGFETLQANVLGQNRPYRDVRWVTLQMADGILLPVPAALMPEIRPFLEADLPQLFNESEGALQGDAGLDISVLPKFPAEEDGFYFAIADMLRSEPNRYVRLVVESGSSETADRINRYLKNEFGLGGRLRVEVLHSGSQMNKDIQRMVTSVYQAIPKTVFSGTLKEFYGRVSFSGANFNLLKNVLAPLGWRIGNDLDQGPAAQTFLIRRKLDLVQKRLTAERIRKLEEIQRRVISAAREFLTRDDLGIAQTIYNKALAARKLYTAA